MKEQESDILRAIAEGRELETANGGEVRIYCTDAGGAFPIHGAERASKSEPWALRTWTGEGRHQPTITSALDLVIKPRTIEIAFWANVYEDGSYFRYETKKEADAGASSSRYACINIKRPVTEGEGL